MKKTIKDFVTSNGKIPYREWLTSIKDPKTRAVIENRVLRVRDGNMGHVRSVGSGVHELKIDFGPGYRVYFGNDGEELVILLLAGSKNKQTKDIEKAKVYWADYQSR